MGVTNLTQKRQTLTEERREEGKVRRIIRERGEKKIAKEIKDKRKAGTENTGRGVKVKKF